MNDNFAKLLRNILTLIKYINLYINWCILVYKFSLTEYIKSEFLFDFSLKTISYSSQFDIISHLIELCFLIDRNTMQTYGKFSKFMTLVIHCKENFFPQFAST